MKFKHANKGMINIKEELDKQDHVFPIKEW